MTQGRAFAQAGRRLGMGLVGLASAASLAAQPQARDAARPAVGLAGLAGVIISADEAAAPIRSATVMLTDVTGRVPSRTTETDTNGRFEFEGLPAGRYDVSATKAAYLRTSYGAVRPMRTGTPIAINSGQQVTNVALKMWRGGVITGVLFDEKNHPLPNVTVSVRRLQTVNGVRTMAAPTISSAPTDPRGLYRIFGLPPGDYVVLSTLAAPGRAGPIQPAAAHQVTAEEVQRALRNVTRAGNDRVAAPPVPSSAPVLGYAPVYFPGTTVSVDAVPVHVEAGEERGGIDFAAQLVAVAEVSGMIAPPDGRTIADLQISVGLVARSGPSGLVASRPISVAADGKFTIGAVTPGQYTLTARATLQPTVASDQSRAVGWWASTPVSIVGLSVSGLDLTLEPGATVTGRVVFDGGSPPSMAAVGVSVRLTPTQEGQSGTDNVRVTSVTPEGTFTITGVAPGDYLLLATLIARSGPITGWTFKSASAGGRDLTDVPLTISAGRAVDAIVVSFTDQVTEISGVFHNAGRPSSEYFIVALPADRALWSAGARRVQLVRPATDGKYLITGLPAGDYALVATTDAGPDDLLDRSFLEQLMSASAVRVSLKHGAKVTQDIHVSGTAADR